MMRFTKFRLKTKYNEKYTVNSIKNRIPWKCEYIGIFKSEDVMYIYVQLKKSVRVTETSLKQNFNKFGILNGPVDFKIIEKKGLELLHEEGRLTKRGPKITNGNNMNPVGKEDTSGIRCESIINMIKNHIDYVVIKCKEDSKNCICYTSICDLHKKIGCESVHCRLSQDDRKAWQGFHTNKTCQTFTPMFTRECEEMSVDKFLYVAFLRNYFFSDVFIFYNIFEELLYKNSKNHNISVGNKDGKYSYFDGKEIIKGELIANYYEDVIKKRIPLLREMIDNIFECWSNLEESYGYLRISTLKLMFTSLVNHISDLEPNETEADKEERNVKMRFRFKAICSDSKIITGMKTASKKRCRDNPINNHIKKRRINY